MLSIKSIYIILEFSENYVKIFALEKTNEKSRYLYFNKIECKYDSTFATSNDEYSLVHQINYLLQRCEIFIGFNVSKVFINAIDIKTNLQTREVDQICVNNLKDIINKCNNIKIGKIITSCDILCNNTQNIYIKNDATFVYNGELVVKLPIGFDNIIQNAYKIINEVLMINIDKIIEVKLIEKIIAKKVYLCKEDTYSIMNIYDGNYLRYKSINNKFIKNVLQKSYVKFLNEIKASVSLQNNAIIYGNKNIVDLNNIGIDLNLSTDFINDCIFLENENINLTLLAFNNIIIKEYYDMNCVLPIIDAKMTNKNILKNIFVKFGKVSTKIAAKVED